MKAVDKNFLLHFTIISKYLLIFVAYFENQDT